MFKSIVWHVLMALVMSAAMAVIAMESASVGAVIFSAGGAVIAGLSQAVTLRNIRTRKAWARRRELATRYSHLKVAC